MSGFHKRCTTHPSLVNDEAHLHELLLSSIAICHKTLSQYENLQGIFGRVAILFADHLIFLHLCTVNIGINHDGKEFGFSKLSFEVSAAKSQRCPSVPATGRPSDSSQHLLDSFYSSLQIISKATRVFATTSVFVFFLQTIPGINDSIGGELEMKG